jgi:pimeloyl-ACP methyl ester carboxylesterase
MRRTNRPQRRAGAPTRLDATLAALNGVLGDYLRRRANPLRIDMALHHRGAPLACEREALTRVHPAATGRLCVLVHGLAMNEGAWSFPDDPDRTYGAALERELGFTAYEVRYNTGLHVSENGALLADLLDALCRQHPVAVEELVLVGHSMGGLVVRSACEDARRARQAWLGRLSRAFYLGSPHHGAALERAGNVVAWALDALGVSVTSVIADVGKLRSAGIKDLRFGSIVSTDWEGRDPDALLEDGCTPVPFARGVAHHFGVGGLAAHERHLVTRLLGDAMVSVASAAARGHPREEGTREDVRFFPRVGHLALAHDEEVARWIVGCCRGDVAPEVS